MRFVVPPLVLQAIEILSKAGFKAYLVGGAIRDSLLRLSPTDWDVATDAQPEHVEVLFKKTIPTGKQFGTMTVLLEGKPIEITTMRSDGPYSDGRHPDYITFTNSLKEDLSRRDFTINALAYDPLADTLIDPFRGSKHLRKKLLVTVGDPTERFQEDPLRMLRLVRFQSTLGFKIEKKTGQTLVGLSRSISSVSPERILNELDKMLLGRELFSSLETLFTSGLMEQVIPELSAGHKISPGESHPLDLLGHSMLAAHFAPPNLELKWAALLHDVGKKETLKRHHAEISAQWAEGILRRLKANNAFISRVSNLIRHHMFAVQPHCSNREIRRFLATVGVETAFDLIKLRQADMAGMNLDPRQVIFFCKALEARFNEVLAVEHALSLSDLNIDGNDLIESLNLMPGPIVGNILQDLLERVWDDPSLNRPDTLMDLAQKYLESSQQSQR